ncbi:MAG: cytochrome c5 family protein [Betaproteobacteria bacterium]|nr:cytochrome c5 family protein [Betaproteobacteria bacterium]
MKIPTLLLTAILPIAALAQPGEATYKAVCAACHTSGVANAPKLGDAKKWGPLIREGQAVLTAHGYVGIRGMPAKGGKPDLSVEDFADAVAYMVNQSGGKWQSPDAKTLAAIRTEIDKREKAIAAKARK